jgi:outer membrane protein insertion porin family
MPSPSTPPAARGPARAGKGWVFLRLCGLFLLVGLLPDAWAQFSSFRVLKIEIKHVENPAAVNDDLIRANIRVKPGDPYLRSAVDDDVRNLYGTGLFYNIRVTDEITPDGVVLTYVVQARPKLTDIKFTGNKKFSDAKLRKKLSSKIGEPLDERKLFTDSQEIHKAYEKSGSPSTQVKYVPNIDEQAGRATATFEITESPKVKITKVEFVGAQAFSQRKLRKQVKTRKHWMFSWLTSHGFYKEDEFEDDKERLADFYRDHGYIDFEIKDVQFEYPTPKTLVIRFIVYEGRQYKIGTVTFKGTTMFPTNKVDQVLQLHPGAVFTPKALTKDIERIEDFYGSRGRIEVNQSSGDLRVIKIPNTETGTMDLEYRVDEGQEFKIEKIEIRGNTKTKDRVIRRELAVSPGERFDMVRVKISKQRLEGLQFFEKVDARPESTDPPIVGRKNLIVAVDEKNTGNLTMGAGFSSVDAVVGFVEVSQGNFDLFNPPTFTGGGQKFRLRVQLGTERQDYVLSFIEPWFLGQKLALGVDLYHRELNFQSLDNLYDEVRTGARLSLSRTLGSDFLIGSVSYTIENVGILLDNSLHGDRYVREIGLDNFPIIRRDPANAPRALLDEDGYSLISKIGASIAYDTRNSVALPNKGQRTELFAEFAGGPFGGERDFYKVELRTAWYFKGLFTGHVLEMVGGTGVASGLSSGDSVPFYERYYLGGLNSLRGFRYRSVSPREPGFDEPVGGNTYWFGSAEYSIPIIPRLRFALFYDIGAVESDSYSYKFSDFSDNWGIGLRLNLPIGPLRLDYGIPIHHDDFNSGSGRFQFGVGYRREF